jgi:hypothetical protein
MGTAFAIVLRSEVGIVEILYQLEIVSRRVGFIIKHVCVGNLLDSVSIFNVVRFIEFIDRIDSICIVIVFQLGL